APDLLPERTEVQYEIDARWNPDLPFETTEFEYAVLHPGVVRSVISCIGSEAGLNGTYWKRGLCVFEANAGSVALIEQQTDDDWRGRLRVQTQCGQARSLLGKLTTLIEQEGARAGAKPVKVTLTSPSHRSAVSEDLAAASAQADGSSRFPSL